LQVYLGADGFLYRLAGQYWTLFFLFFFSSRRRHTRWPRDWSSDVCSSDLTIRCAQCHRICMHSEDSAKRMTSLRRRESKTTVSRSEERRVGKECRSRWSPDH